MLLVAMLQRPRVTIIHVIIVEDPVISPGNVRILNSIIQVLRRLLPINNRVKHRTRTTIRMLRRAKMKGRPDVFSIFKLGKFQKGTQ